jgi:nitroimidazol reductase NimA-like FMN-containing flavoprotein (pyridoxamine 5'-phosphate oxidase superfamily)
MIPSDIRLYTWVDVEARLAAGRACVLGCFVNSGETQSD